MEQKTACRGLLRRRQCLVPTWRGCLLLIAAVAGVAIFATREAYPFLAVNQPVTGGVLVVEGWVQAEDMEAAVAEFRRNHYDKVYVTGAPLAKGSPLAEYKTYADLGAVILHSLGLETNVLQAVPCPTVRQDRTYTEAVSLGRWWREHGGVPAKLNLVTSGPHARRSRLLFEKALGDNVSVGVIALEEQSYDPKRWWHSSEGFRTVTGEALAYAYARFLFRAPKE
jgi:hypothetical protein